MIITVTTEERNALAKAINGYADLAFTCMRLTDTLPTDVTRENCLENLKKEIDDPGKITFVNDTTIIVNEEALISVAKASQATVTMLQKLAPLLVPVAMTIKPIIKEYVKELNQI